MPDPIDAETLYAEGALRATVKGLVLRYRREQRTQELAGDVVAPVLRLAVILRDQGDQPAADLAIAHLVHDGINPTMLQETQIADAVTQPDAYRVLFADNPAVDSLLATAADTAAAAVAAKPT